MQRTRFDIVIECREAFLYLRTNIRKYHSQTQTDVPHYRPSHQPSPFVLISNITINIIYGRTQMYLMYTVTLYFTVRTVSSIFETVYDRNNNSKMQTFLWRPRKNGITRRSFNVYERTGLGRRRNGSFERARVHVISYLSVNVRADVDRYGVGPRD